jgi:acetyl-CoA synthetase
MKLALHAGVAALALVAAVSGAQAQTRDQIRIVGSSTVFPYTQAVAEQFGAPFRPRYFAFVSELPKTRNQKIMRRVIRSIATGSAVGDLSSLANPAAVQELTAAFATRSLTAKSAVTVATND